MDEDLENEKGIPGNAVKLARLIASHDAVLMYGGGVQRLDPAAPEEHDRLGEPRQPRQRPAAAPRYPGRIAAICSSSDGRSPASAAPPTCAPCSPISGVEVIAPQVSVPNGAEAFAEDGSFREERLRKGMTRLCRTLIEHARAFWTRYEP